MAVHHAGAQSRAAEVSHQRGAYQRIERELPQLRHAAASMDTIGLARESADGGLLTAYCAADTLRLIVADYYGELGDGTSRFYFERDSVFFVLVESRRGHPTGEPYPKRTVVRHERFYFASGRLTRWLDERGRSRDLGSREAGERATDLLTDAYRYRAKMPACRPQYAPHHD